MTNKNYISGRRKEYKIMNQLKKEGFNIVLRSAGSHSPIDVIAIKNLPNWNRIEFIQCKPKNFSKKLKGELEFENSWLTKNSVATFRVL